MNTRFWLHLVIDPFTALDLTDRHGNADHGKVLPAILLISAIVLQFLEKQFSVAVLITLGSLSYGYGMWRSFLKSKTVMSRETLQVNDITIEQILARRDAATGIDPTYE